MIAVSLKNAAARLPGRDGFARALQFLLAPGLAELPDGRYEIDGEKVFAMVQRYETAVSKEPRFEAHRKYIDVQFIAGGTEIIGWAPLENIAVSRPYAQDEDVCFGAAAAWSPVLLGPGELAVFFPEDAHAPRLAAGIPGAVVKIVIKVAVK